MGISESHPASDTPRSRWTPRSIILLSALYLVLGLAVFSWLARVDNEYVPTGSSCQNNLKQLGLVFNMYANDHGGMFPEISPMPGVLAVREDQDYPGIYPEYIADLYIFRCPGITMGRPRDRWFWEDPPPSPERLDTASNDQCYLYLGYTIPDQATLEHFAAAYRARVTAGEHFDEDLSTVDDEGVSARIPRLRVDAPDTMDTDEAPSTVPVLVERFPNGHIPDGGNVVYLDGYTEFIKWGAKWPMTPEAMEVLMALDGLGDD